MNAPLSVGPRPTLGIASGTLVVFMGVLAFCTVACADMTLDRLIQIAWQSQRSIVSYDVTVKTEETFHFKVIETADGRIEHHAYDSGEEPYRRISFSRQARSRDGKRLYLTLNTAEGHWAAARVFDGQSTRVLDRERAFDRVDSNIHPATSQFVPFDANYELLLGELSHGGSLWDLLKQRRATQLVSRSSKGKTEYRIVSPPEELLYRDFGWRIWANPAAGFLPQRIEHFLRDHDLSDPFCETVIEEYHKVESDVVVPIRATHIHYLDGKPYHTLALSVLVVHSRWNQVLEDHLFHLSVENERGVIHNDGFERERDLAIATNKDALEGKVPPALVAEGFVNTGGNRLTLAELKGHVVLIDFWGVWCGPCLRAIPRLRELAQKHQDAGLVVVGIHTTKEGGKMSAFVEEQGIEYPVAVDVDQKTVRAFKVDSYPDYYLIDRKGKLRFADLANSELDRAILMLLEEE